MSKPKLGRKRYVWNKEKGVLVEWKDPDVFIPGFLSWCQENLTAIQSVLSYPEMDPQPDKIYAIDRALKLKMRQTGFSAIGRQQLIETFKGKGHNPFFEFRGRSEPLTEEEAKEMLHVLLDKPEEEI